MKRGLWVALVVFQLVKRVPTDDGDRALSFGPIRMFVGAGEMVCEPGKTGQSGRGLTHRLRQLQGLLIIRFPAEFPDKPIKRRSVQARKRMSLSLMRRYDSQWRFALVHDSLVNDFGHSSHPLRAFGPRFSHEDRGDPAFFVCHPKRRKLQAPQTKYENPFHYSPSKKNGLTNPIDALILAMGFPCPFCNISGERSRIFGGILATPPAQRLEATELCRCLEHQVQAEEVEPR